MSKRVLLGVFGGCAVLAGAVFGGAACGEARALDLFPRKEPPPPPMMPAGVACGDLVMCPPDRNLCVDGQCVQCAEDAQCMAPKPACFGGTCVECRDDAQCPKDKVCHPEVGRCTEPCIDVGQCKDKERAVCEVTRGLCVKCTGDGDCDDKHVCDVSRNECVGCLDDGICGDAGVCDLRVRECAK